MTYMCYVKAAVYGVQFYLVAGAACVLEKLQWPRHTWVLIGKLVSRYSYNSHSYKTICSAVMNIT